MPSKVETTRGYPVRWILFCSATGVLKLKGAIPSKLSPSCVKRAIDSATTMTISTTKVNYSGCTLWAQFLVAGGWWVCYGGCGCGRVRIKLTLLAGSTEGPKCTTQKFNQTNESRVPHQRRHKTPLCLRSPCSSAQTTTMLRVSPQDLIIRYQRWRVSTSNWYLVIKQQLTARLQCMYH